MKLSLVLLVVLALVALASSQTAPKKPAMWPINWTLQVRVREECTGSGANATERFFTLFYSSISSQFRADVSYGVGVNTYTQYYNYRNNSAATFYNTSPAGAAHCSLIKLGSTGVNSFLLPRNWTQHAKWAGQTEIDGVRANAWLGTDYSSWWGNLFGCNVQQMSYVVYESISLLPKPIRMEFFRGAPRPNWDESDVVMIVPLTFLESGLFDFHQGVFEYDALVKQYCK